MTNGPVATDAIETVLEIPQWVIDVHKFRVFLFQKYIEPGIVFIFGPVEEIESNNTIISNDINPYQDYNPNVYDATHRRLGFLPQYVYDAKPFDEKSMNFKSMLFLFFMMASIGLIFLSCFYHNQQTSPLFISPRRHRLPKLVPPPLPVDSMLSWVKICFYMSDEEIINRVGFDSLIFLRFHRLALRCIVRMSLFSIPVLLPINFTGGGHSNASEEEEEDKFTNISDLFFTDFMKFTMANVKGGSPRLWVHCFAAYLLSAIVIKELLVEYSAFHSIRHRYMLSREPHLRTVLVTNIPRHLRSASKIRNYFSQVYKDDVKSVTVCQNLIRLERLVLDRTNVLCTIERELLVLCRNEKRKLLNLSVLQTWGVMPLYCCEKIGLMETSQERLAKMYNKLEELNQEITDEQRRRRIVMKKMNSMEAGKGRKDIDYVLATPFFDQESLQPSEVVNMNQANILNSQNHSNKLGLDRREENTNTNDPKQPFAKARDAIRRYSTSVGYVNMIGRQERSIDQTIANVSNDSKHMEYMEDHTIEVTDKAFIRMKTFTASTIAIQSMHSSRPGAMSVTAAPEPRDVLWENIYTSKGAKRTRGYIIQALSIIFISLYIVPVALISLLVSESSLNSMSGRLSQLSQASALFSTGIAMVQPMCIVGIQQLLPPLFMYMTKAEGIVAFSEVQMNAFSRYFLFQVINIFLVSCIAGSIFDTVAIVSKAPENIFLFLGNSLPRMSSFFTIFVTIKCCLGLGVELVRTMSIVQTSLRQLIFPNSTLREKKRVRIGMRAIDDPGWFPYHKILAQDMLVVVISVVFAVIAPIVLLPCAIFFLFSRIMWTHHHLYVFESVFESGGLFWPKIFRRFVFGLITAQATITGQFILKEARKQAYATIPLMFISYFFLRSTRARYDRPSSTLPLEVAAVMDIAVAQENKAKHKKGKDQTRISHTVFRDDMSREFEQKQQVIGQIDPFENAYMQPALRANQHARPEQPFPPAQLGREEMLIEAQTPLNNESEYQMHDKSATVKLKYLNQNDRVVLNKWWNDQLQDSGEQPFFSILVGEESGTLRLGKGADLYL